MRVRQFLLTKRNRKEKNARRNLGQTKVPSASSTSHVQLCPQSRRLTSDSTSQWYYLRALKSKPPQAMSEFAHSPPPVVCS